MEPPVDTELPLHYYAFFNQHEKLDELLTGNISDDRKQLSLDINKQDSYANKVYGRLRDHALNDAKVANLSRRLAEMPDCTLKFDWELISWVPFLSKRLPSDSCTIRKTGTCLRVDTTFFEPTAINGKHESMSIVFNPLYKPTLTIWNHEEQIYYSAGEMADKSHDVDVLVNTPLVSIRLNADAVGFSRAHSRTFRRTSRKINNFDVTNYVVSNLIFRTVKRSEHLTERKKHLHHSRRKSQGENVENYSRNRSLSPPQDQKRNLELGERNTANVSWMDYAAGKLRPMQTYLGRKPEMKRWEKRPKLYLAMTDQVPLKPCHLLDIFRAVSPFSKFAKLYDALQTKIPPGFPLRLEIPLFPTIYGRVIFTDVAVSQTLSPNTTYDRAPSETTNAAPPDGDMRRDSDGIRPASIKLVIPTSSVTVNSNMNIFKIPEQYTYAGEFQLSKPKRHHRKSDR